MRKFIIWSGIDMKKINMVIFDRFTGDCSDEFLEKN